MKKPRILVGATSIVFFIIIWKLYGIESGVEELKQELEYQENINRFPLSLERIVNPVTIYCVTPTYWRLVQKAELIQVLQTLTLASFKVNIKWIVIEDSEQKTSLVTNLLKRIDDAGDSRLSYVHLNAKTPPFQQLKAKDPRWKKHRGVEQRNAALKWIRENIKPHGSKKIIFFMDDDNTYDVRLFEEIAKVDKVGVWPVGLVGGLNLETPIVDPKTGEVLKFKSGWQSKRVFSLDMAAFGINIELILNKTITVFSYRSEVGYLENDFLSELIEKRQLEPLANNCTKVYVWHTRTMNPEALKKIELHDEE
ncbi:galactosylgalactosylxylosylprotein 3-beta-glucuronosyltransferase sqv-8 isoform X3 [Coccinella septempunctata]|uniref:galactosylgalactosylxylosylprotein 3-beta-glucuronosyltransferase sqv-8 isoform X3 n=1 Tax=Coccinella septempunctata TaxID=41139 RepID=UPI001D0958ED|nr:galactosylgalactosylxylosylprotein 3-beta-glucuronosyltransferase sqv-8 isoform X3 [Coccinella septempunctata]